ncbi:hypothetical protein [Shimia sagamensis]|uniref:Uncharacterized protein n=1 Tax=Shimia sagamensis TaxID=1566352 RepID=A0ABY1PFM4_9RHOB|nr:hypothetical protein [Shimia sagamensis]SMP31636.1 hypothetical protein SAMN06265373_10829 [Shimia sagamensis]
MAQNSKKKSSTVALLAAFAVLLITILGLGWNVLLSAALAAVAFFAVSQMGTKPEETTTSAPTSPVQAAHAPQETSPAPEQAAEPPTSVASEPVQAATATMAGQVKLGTLLPGERELAERRGGWRYEG